MMKLTARQTKAIPFIVSSPTYTEGAKKAGISTKTFYEWLEIPEFKAELDRQRDEVAAEAFRILSQSLTKAVETLVALRAPSVPTALTYGDESTLKTCNFCLDFG